LTTSRPTRRHTVVTLIDRLRIAGGAERLAVELASRLDPSRFESIVWTTRASEGLLVSQLVERGIPVYSLERNSPFELWAWRPLLRFLRDQRVDVLHAHKFGSNVWGVVLARVARVPVMVAHEHTWSWEGEPLRRALDRHLVARGASVFVAVSREDRRRMSDVEGIDPARTRFIPNGMPPLAPPSGADVRAELGIAADAPVVGTVGVLRPQKGLDVLVAAARIVAGEVPEARFVVVGAGPEQAALRDRVAASGLADRLLLTGFRADVADTLAAFDVAVSSSFFEGSPLAVMEYMAAGKPIVATAVGGVPDLIEDGVHGLLVPPGDPRAFADAVLRLLREPATASRLGEQARARQQSEFTMDAMVRRFEELYDELLRAHDRG
jgi:glycosyltransferase involved in cell wall biosynthesis